MQDIKTIAQRLDSSSGVQKLTQDSWSKLEKIAESVTGNLFPVLQIYTRDFNGRAGLHPEFVAKEFAKEILKAGINGDQFRQGIETFKSSAADKPFMPNPAEFVEMCKQPMVKDAPGTREAYMEACKNAGFLTDAKWSHPAVYVAGKATGWFELRNRPEKDTWPIFKQAFKEALQRVANGEDLSIAVPKAQIESRSVFQANLDTPGRLKALQLLGKKP